MLGRRRARLIAITYVLIGVAIVGPNDVLIPLLKDHIGVWQFHLLRGIVVVLAVGVIAGIMHHRFFMRSPAKIAVRTLFYTLSMALYFSSLSFLPVAVTGAGLFTAPIFVLIFSAALFGQKIGRRRITAVAIGSAGTLTILNPSGEIFSWFNIMPVLGGAFLALGHITTKRYCAKEDPTTLLLTNFLGMAFCGAIGVGMLTLFPVSPSGNITAFMVENWGQVTPYVLLLITIQGLVAMVGIWLLTRAYQIGDPTYLNVFEYAFLISIGFSGWLFLNQNLTLHDLAGIAMIVTAGIIVAQVKKKAAL